jgi:hypothetical protein
MGEKRHAYRIFVGKPKGKRRRWVDNTLKWIVDRVGWCGLYLFGSG